MRAKESYLLPPPLLVDCDEEPDLAVEPVADLLEEDEFVLPVEEAGFEEVDVPLGLDVEPPVDVDGLEVVPVVVPVADLLEEDELVLPVEEAGFEEVDFEEVDVPPEPPDVVLFPDWVPGLEEDAEPPWPLGLLLPWPLGLLLPWPLGLLLPWPLGLLPP